MAFVGTRTYTDAPPIPSFVSSTGDVVLARASILRGQTVFLRYALMEYGSMFGDGAGRGPDYTADALHRTALAMQDYYLRRAPGETGSGSEWLPSAVAARVQREIKRNLYDEETNTVVLSRAQIHAYDELVRDYTALFVGDRPDSFKPAGYITDRGELRDLAAFFFWGGWVCGVERPGKDYSYTHNWPYDETAGNRPTSATVLWSVLGSLGLILSLGVVLFLYGRFSQLAGWRGADRNPDVATRARVEGFRPSVLQRATYKFFAAALLLLCLQIVAGILTVHDFLGLTEFFGVDLAKILPITITRSWHLQLALMWISACWIGASIFVLSTASEEQPRGQLPLVNLLFALFVVLVLGDLVGICLGPKGVFGEQWNLLGHQGWEFVELGKLWQGLLFVILALWCVIVYRAVPATSQNRDPWVLSKWLLYAVLAILILFLSGFVAKPTTNFVIADFWRWAVIHMWVEAFFEVFATVVLAYFMYLMGLVSHSAATRIVYVASLLFLGSGLLGISHNFYWNAKPVATLAIGSIFSTLQVVPLVLLTVEAWQFRKQPERLLASTGRRAEALPFGQSEAFLFLLAVNFWNFMGAGVFGFIINLPIVNYYEHGTYLTVNHGHAALMGVYGNLALAAVVFCSRYLIEPAAWNQAVLRRVFWSLNVGLALMVVMDLFPVGVHQLVAVLDHGLWYARSHEFISGVPFQSLTWARIVGGAVFVLGGVAPLAWFILSRTAALKPATRPAPSGPAPEPIPAARYTATGAE